MAFWISNAVKSAHISFVAFPRVWHSDKHPVRQLEINAPPLDAPRPPFPPVLPHQRFQEISETLIPSHHDLAKNLLG